jgi:RNA polymerase sigma-70 factor (ECF subfamily)
VSSTSPSTERSPSRRKSSAPDGAAAERQLARWIAEGDEEALAELFDLTGPVLYAVAFGVCQNPRQAEGAVEETLAELWEKRASLGRLPALSPWLLERCRIWALSLRSGGHVPHLKALQERTADVPLTRRLLRCPEPIRISRVQAALDRLEDHDREALLLASRSGLSVAEISRQQGHPAEQVHQSIRRSLQSVREELERTVRREIV